MSKNIQQNGIVTKLSQMSAVPNINYNVYYKWTNNLLKMNCHGNILIL